MKKILLAVVVLLSGCSLMPIPHDGAMFDDLVSVKMSVDKLSCSQKDYSWNDARDKIQKLQIYTEWRGDPQAKSIAQLGEAIQKAADTKSQVFCEGILKINKTRIDVIADAWKGR
jgi:hypothetical protein